MFRNDNNEQTVQRAVASLLAARSEGLVKISRLVLGDLLDSLFEQEAFRQALRLLDQLLAEIRDEPLFYLNAAIVGENLAHQLQGEYFESKGAALMDPANWIMGEGTPFEEVFRLTGQAAERLQSFLELSPNLPADVRSDIEDRIFDLQYR